MAPRARLFAITGDAVARLSLSDGQVEEGELALEGSAAQCVAVDPNDSNRAYVGTFHDGVYVTDDGGLSWRQAGARLGKRPGLARAGPRDPTQRPGAVAVPRGHHRSPPDRPRLAARWARARRGDGLDRWRGLVGRPQPAGRQRRPRAPNSSRRPRP